jgi:PhnB protein
VQLVPYLGFDGDCREAFDFYHEVLGGELVAMISHEDMQIPGLSDEWQSRIMHARLIIGDTVLMGGDTPPGSYSPPSTMCVSAQVATPFEAERIFSALADGGSIQMPLEPQEWATRFGMLTDRFGTPWMVNCESNE